MCISEPTAARSFRVRSRDGREGDGARCRLGNLLQTPSRRYRVGADGVAERVRQVDLSSFFSARQEADEFVAAGLADLVEMLRAGGYHDDDDDDDEHEGDLEHQYDPYGYRFGSDGWADDDCGA